MTQSPGERGLDAGQLSSWLSAGGLGIPFALWVYMLARSLGLPAWLLAPLPIAAVIGSTILVGRRSRPSVPAGGGRSAGALLALAVFIVAVPAVRTAWKALEGPTLRFFFHDEAYILMIARGLESAFPAPDLAFSGEDNRYHPGSSLLVEMISRASGLSLPTVFYSVIPLVVGICSVGAMWRFFRLFSPDWGTSRCLVAVLVSIGLVTVDLFDVIWNLRALVMTGSVSWSTVWVGMPILRLEGVGAFVTPLYTLELAFLFLVFVLSNVDRAPALVLGPALAALYMTKSQLGVAVLAGWALAAVARVIAARDFVPLRVWLTALVCLLPCQRIGPGTGELTVSLGWGAALNGLRDLASPYSAGLGTKSGALVVAVGIVITLLRYNVLWLIGMLFAGRRLRDERADRGRSVATITSATILSGLGVATLLVVHPGPEQTRRFEAIHGAFRDVLWLPFQGYLDKMFTDISLGAVLQGTRMLVALVAAAALVEAQRSKVAWLRTSAALAAVVMVVAGFADSISRATVGLQRRTEHSTVIPIEGADALRSIPVAGSIILTNDLEYDPEKARHLPVQNLWLPIPFGHQFWAVDFMFDTHYVRVEERFRKVRRFFSEPPGDWHARFLETERINWVLFRKRGVGWSPGEWKGLEIVRENTHYIVARVSRLESAARRE